MTAGQVISLSASDPRPLISVIMANYRGAEHLAAALAAVLSQSVADLEVIVSDDASPDHSVEIVRRVMATDRRVSLIEAEANRGPAAARNAALRAARGEWVAIVDSDDIIHTERLERLLAAALRLNADAVADDLLFFSSEPSEAKTLLDRHAGREPLLVTPDHFILSATSEVPSLGYLKPFFRRDAIKAISYDETVRIGEDYDFLLRVLLDGGRFYLVPDPLYLYRRHAGSVSHRLSEGDVQAMVANHEAFVSTHGPFRPAIAALLQRRYESLLNALAFERLVAAVQKRELAGTVTQLAMHPSLLLPLLQSATSHIRRRRRPTLESASDKALRPIALAAASAASTGNVALYEALGAESGTTVITVPAYRPVEDTGATESATRALWVDLARAGSRPDTQVVCHGLAGLYAASFLPSKTMVGVVIDEASEATHALSWAARVPAPTVVAHRVLAALPSGTRTRDFCDGYHLVEASAFEATLVDVAAAAIPRAVEGGSRHGR